jgi:hypothetical protein
MLAVVGSRKYQNYNFVEEKILEWEKNNIKIERIISGGALGVDKLAETFSKKHNLPNPLIFKPDYQKYPGNIAPIMRNTQIVESANYLIAFPTKDSTGTWDTIRKAQLKKIPITIHNV